MKISRPTRPKSTVFTCYRCFIQVCIRPFRADAGRQNALWGGRDTRTRPVKSTQKGTFVWFGAHGARKFKFSHFLGCCFGSGAAAPYIFASPQGCSSTGAAPGLEKCKGDMPMTNVRKNSAKLTREDLKIAPESPTMELSETPAVEPSDQTSKTGVRSGRTSKKKRN